MQVSSSLVKKVKEFPLVKGSNQNKQLRDLLHLCRLIDSYMSVCNELRIFNLASGLRDIWSKLPDHLQNKWRTYGNEYEDRHFGLNPSLSIFIIFLEIQVKEICNPNYEKVGNSRDFKNQKHSLTTVLKTEFEESHTSTDEHSDIHSTQTKASCPIHLTSRHDLSDCFKFKSLTYEDKRKVLVENRRCFKCTGNHMIKSCPSDLKCDLCNGNHSALMHKERRDPEYSDKYKRGGSEQRNSLCTRVCNNYKYARNCSKTLLVELSLPNISDRVLKTYAILDDQSSSSFIDPSVIEYFKAPSTPVNYSLKTLQGLKTEIQGRVVDNLVIRGVGCSQTFELPSMLTNGAIPDTKDEIATPNVVRMHKHVRHLAPLFNELDSNAQVTLLLGRNCEQILPVKCHGDKVPYAYETKLGYALVGKTCLQQNTYSNICLRTSLDHEHFRARSQIISSDKSLAKLPLVENVFEERPDDELRDYSVEERRFLEIMNDKVYVNEENHITLPLPFRESEPFLPNNQEAVYCRTKNTLLRLKKDKFKLDSCLASMKKNIDSKFVEVVPTNELVALPGRAWWLPIFPVTHANKKVRLVFDSSAVYAGTCLNDHLLKGPDENNRLKGVLMRFRKGPVGFSCDVEAMFNQFHVSSSDSNYLRFHWFMDNDPTKPLIQYRARVHIFGNKPSPAIANFGLKYAIMSESDSRIKQFIYDNVYVDDGLCSTDSAESAVQIIESTRKSLKKVGVRLCKIVSNSSEVLKAFAPSERASPELVDLNGNEIHGALGVAWETKEDKFVFIRRASNKPFTRRGILSVLNSVYDPLGMLLPFVVSGRILQR